MGEELDMIFPKFLASVVLVDADDDAAGCTACSYFMIHPQKLTWNLEMMVSNRNLLFQGSIFRFHVCFGGCMFNISCTCWDATSCLSRQHSWQSQKGLHKQPAPKMSWSGVPETFSRDRDVFKKLIAGTCSRKMCGWWMIQEGCS